MEVGAWLAFIHHMIGIQIRKTDTRIAKEVFDGVLVAVRRAVGAMSVT